MNELEIKLSSALDAITALHESMIEYHSEVLGRAPINLWEELATQARHGLELAAATQQTGRVTRIADNVRRRLTG